jgi:hypothetical protein
MAKELAIGRRKSKVPIGHIYQAERGKTGATWALEQLAMATAPARTVTTPDALGIRNATICPVVG